MKLAPELSAEDVIIICLSGRGDSRTSRPSRAIEGKEYMSRTENAFKNGKAFVGVLDGRRTYH